MPKKRAKRPTKAEQDERQRFVSGLWRAGIHSGEIKRHFEERFDCEARSAEPYMTRARDELLEDLGRPSEEHQVEALAVYRRIVRMCLVLEPRSAIAAQKRIDKILGNEAATRMRVEFSGEFRTVVDLLQDDELAAEIEEERASEKSTRPRRKKKGRAGAQKP